ncbi:MAG: hypothetical protein IIY70_00470 [Oscillospiraceae bacterium]|nr:hypothetical protein [Oscillospiraceae bacterium]
MNQFLAVFTAILIFLVIGLPIYYFIYRKRINQALEQTRENENAVVGTTPEPRSGGKILLWLLVILVTVSLFNRLNQISDSVQNAQISFQNEVSYLHSTLSEILEAQKKADSMLLSFDAMPTDLDLSAKTLQTNFRVVPKQFRADTRFCLQLDDQSIELQRDEQNTFSATVQLDPFHLPQGGSATLYKTEDGQTTTEFVMFDLNWVDLLSIPKVWLENFDLQTGSAGYITQDACAEITSNGTISDFNIAVRAGDKTLREIPVSVPEDNCARCDLSGEYPVSPGTEIQFWICWKNAEGFSFEYIFCSASGDEDWSSTSTGISNLTVYAPDGSLLGTLDGIF